MAARRTPARMCAVCRRRFPQPDLVRVTRLRDGDGAIAIDERGRGAQGRGAYVGPHRACWSHPDLVRRVFSALRTAPSEAAMATLQDFGAGRPERDERADACPRLAGEARQADEQRA